MIHTPILKYFSCGPLPLLQEMYLTHMIRSMLKQLQLGERDQTLLSFIDKAMRVEERKKLLESQYSQELSLLYILQEDYDRAKYYTNHAMELFMQVCCLSFFFFFYLSPAAFKINNLAGIVPMFGVNFLHFM